MGWESDSIVGAERELCGSYSELPFEARCNRTPPILTGAAKICRGMGPGIDKEMIKRGMAVHSGWRRWEIREGAFNILRTIPRMGAGKRKRPFGNDEAVSWTNEGEEKAAKMGRWSAKSYQNPPCSNVRYEAAAGSLKCT